MLCPLPDNEENKVENQNIKICNDIMQKMNDFIEKPLLYRMLNWHEYVSLKEQWKDMCMFKMEKK